MLLFEILIPSSCILLLSLVHLFIFLSKAKQNTDLQNTLDKQLLIIQERLKLLESQRESIDRLLKENQITQNEQHRRFDEHQIKTLKLIQDSLQQGMGDVRAQINLTLSQNSEEIGKRVDKLTLETQQRLKDISSEVDKRLTSSFEKTTATFSDVMKRLIIIDEAQKKITELSGSVVNLQEILQDKKSRGAFGEVQLASLIQNLIPESHFALQHTLSNGKRTDCMLFLPKPTGNIAIDAKFPLESYRILSSGSLSESEKRQAEQTFRQDIRKHVLDIASKYIIPNETSDGAVMFIPAEAIFAEIHANFSDLVEFSHQNRVWMVSPTTMMAILNTAKAVLKDAATRKQVHIIQKHLIELAKDFDRFQNRMDNLAKHINQAQVDVEEVHKSSKKISSKFNKIEQVELEDESEISNARSLPLQTITDQPSSENSQ